ncbi:MAG: NAD(P)/FAD-dependent oxidoreductase [Bacteroidota bacterium]|nr:NAD(P)/FAD-dependent oxidoreductase [Bacteroidota bacterium]
MQAEYHNTKAPHLIIIGGGFAGLELAKKLKGKAIKVTLLDKNNYHTFQPLLYQVASGGLGSDAIAYPLRKTISTLPNVAFRMAEVLKIIPEQNKVLTSIGEYTYDYLCIASGSTTNFFGNTELEKNCMTLKSIPEALDIRSCILQEFEKALSQSETKNVDRILNFIVVGGGPTGVETAGALAEMKSTVLPADYTELDSKKMHVHLVEASPKLLASMSEESSEAANKFLNKLGVKVWLNTSVQTYNGTEMKLSTGDVLQTETVIWAAGVKGKNIDGIPNEKMGRSNRYKVNAYNQVEGFENIFAMGDVALLSGDKNYPNGHPMVAPVAIQQARLIAKNLFSLISKQPLIPFAYVDKGSMATVGRHKAVLESGKIKTQGYIAWLGWMFLHLMLLVGYRNRLVVFTNWMWNYFTYQRAIRIITRPFIKASSN